MLYIYIYLLLLIKKISDNFIIINYVKFRYNLNG